jgi:ABC-type uncharacterized transport system involved in gliding motility auxiliary subunit
MQTNLHRFAPIGLVIALIGLLALIGALIVQLLVYFGLYYIVQTENIVAVAYTGAIVIIFGMAVFILLDPNRAKAIITGKQARNSSNILILMLAFAGVLIVINMISYKYAKQWDLTTNQQNSLAPESISTLQALPQKVTAYAFYTGSLPGYERLLLDTYKNNSNGKFDYLQIDPEANPVAAKEYGVTRNETIVLVMGDKKEQLTSFSEIDISAGLVRLINPESHTVYFLTGNGERSIEDVSDTAYTRAKVVLTNKNYSVKSLNLLAQGKIPEDASLIVIAGPTKPLTKQEVDLIDTYMTGGGSLIVMEEPSPLTDFSMTEDLLANLLSAQWGITLQDDIIIDPQTKPVTATFAFEYGNHPIAVKLKGISSLYPTVRSLLVQEGSARNAAGLVFTTDQVWGETDFESLKNSAVQFDAQKDHPGQLILAATAEDTRSQSRLVIFGDADFASNALFDQYANGDVFVNSVDWASGLEKVISLTPKNYLSRQFKPPSVLQMAVIIVSSICFIPLFILAAGILAWVSRRRRG